MPQFDIFTYSSQVFCVLLGYFLFYFLILNFYLVQVSEVIKMRQKLLATYSKKRAKADESADLLSYFLRAVLKK